MVLNNNRIPCNDVYTLSIQLGCQADDGEIDCPEGNLGKYNT